MACLFPVALLKRHTHKHAHAHRQACALTRMRTNTFIYAYMTDGCLSTHAVITADCCTQATCTSTSSLWMHPAVLDRIEPELVLVLEPAAVVRVAAATWTITLAFPNRPAVSRPARAPRELALIRYLGLIQGVWIVFACLREARTSERFRRKRFFIMRWSPPYGECGRHRNV